MKDIIWKDLIQNIVRCIVAYPLFLIILTISIPMNVIAWVVWIAELGLCVVYFIFTGSFHLFKYTVIGDLILCFSFSEFVFVIFPITLWITETINDFNKTLNPIKRS